MVMDDHSNDFLIETWDRRKFVTGLGLGASAFLTSGVYAERLNRREMGKTCTSVCDGVSHVVGYELRVVFWGTPGDVNAK